MTEMVEMYEEWYQKAKNSEGSGDYYQQRENHNQALEEYAEALFYFGFSLGFLDKVTGESTVEEMKPVMLLSLATIVQKVISSYVSLKEHKKAAVFAQKLEETVRTLGKYRKYFDSDILNLYKKMLNFSETANILKNTLRIDSSTGKTIAIGDSDPTFQKLSSEFIRCTNSPLCSLL